MLEVVPVRVTVLAADLFVLAGVSAELKGRPEVRLVGSGAEVIVVVGDGEPAGLDPGARWVLVSDDPGPGAGRAVVVPRKEATTARLLRAIRDARHGRVTGRGVPRPVTVNALSRREIAVLRLLAEGRDTGEIAAEMAYSERTVKNIVHGLLRRLDLRNRTHAVAEAVRLGWI